MSTRHVRYIGDRQFVPLVGVAPFYRYVHKHTSFPLSITNSISQWLQV
jgi:hypothetical protein